MAEAHIRGIDTLEPQQADLIMRSVKRGSLGAGLLLAGYFLGPDKLGGFYSGKRKDEELKPGEMKMGETTVPSQAMHHPALMVMQLGAAVRRAQDEAFGKGKRSGEMKHTALGAGWEGLKGLLEEVPLVREQKQASELLTHGFSDYSVRELAKSFAVPQLIQWLARQQDKPQPFNPQQEPRQRKPEGAWEAIKTGVPGWRQTVPLK